MARLASVAAVLGGLAIVAGFVSVVGVVAGSGAAGEDLATGTIELAGGLALLIALTRHRPTLVLLNTLQVVAWTLLVGGGYLALGHVFGVLNVGHVVIVVLVAFAAGGALLRFVARLRYPSEG